MYESVKKLLNDGGKCLLIENGKPLGVILSIEDFNKLTSVIEVKKQDNQFKVSKDSGDDGEKLKMISETLSRKDEPISAIDFEDLNVDDLGMDELPY